MKNLLLILAVIAIGLLSISVYTVNEWERALRFQFGEFSGEEIQPGIHFKTPIVNTIQKFDVRIQTLDRSSERFLSVDKEELLVDSFVKWRINELQKYYKTVGTRANAENRLAQKINNSLKEQIAKRTIGEVVAGDRIEIMNIVQKAIDDEADTIGVEVIDVRLKRVDLADEIQGTVFNRMRTERQRIANEYRAEGDERAIAIRANADRQRIELVAEAEKNAQVLRGEADALATKTYADSFGQDASFYEFYRSLNAYKTTFGSAQDLIILEPDSEFFKHFKSASN